VRGVGRLCGRGIAKGQSQLMAVCPDLLRDFPAAELWIVGEGEGRRELEERARATGVGQAIHFTGRVSDDELAGLYSGATVYAMPSEGEGFGLVFAEAMAHGLPCIASRYDAGSEVVSEGHTGLLVDPRRPEEILSALRRILGDDGLRQDMGKAARRRVDEHFSVRRFNRRMVSILRTGRMED
jgi:phosphatidyl-myo-inositol dimannoside synthase